MKKTKRAPSKASSVKKTKQKQAGPAPIEVDRRGKTLPARQRVGGIITPQ